MIVVAANEVRGNRQEVKGRAVKRNKAKEEIYTPSVAPLISSISRGKERAMLEVVEMLREHRAQATTTN